MTTMRSAGSLAGLERRQPGGRGRYRELREVPATDQAIRAGQPWRPR